MALILFLLLFGLMLVAAIGDMRRYTIPNWLSIAVVALYGVSVPVLDVPLVVVCAHIAVAAIFLLAGIFLFARGWIGGGDAKLLAAGAIWVDPGLVPSYLMAVTLSGGILAFVLILMRRAPWPDAVRTRHRVLQMNAPAPYGVAIAAGTMWIFAEKIKSLAATVDFSSSSLTALTMS